MFDGSGLMDKERHLRLATRWSGPFDKLRAAQLKTVKPSEASATKHQDPDLSCQRQLID